MTSSLREKLRQTLGAQKMFPSQNPIHADGNNRSGGGNTDGNTMETLGVSMRLCEAPVWKQQSKALTAGKRAEVSQMFPCSRTGVCDGNIATTDGNTHGNTMETSDVSIGASGRDENVSIRAASWCMLDRDGHVARAFVAEHEMNAVEVERVTGCTGWRPALDLVSVTPDARAQRIGAALADLIGEPDAEHVMRLVADHGGEVWAGEIVLRRLRNIGVQAAIDALANPDHAIDLAGLLYSAFGPELPISTRTYAFQRWALVAAGAEPTNERRRRASELLAAFAADRCAP